MSYAISLAPQADNEQIESSETLSLHLVLPPEAATQPAPSASTAQPSQGQPSTPAHYAHGSSGAPQNVPQANETVHAHQRPLTQGNVPTSSPSHYHAHGTGFGHGHGHGNGAFPQGQFPPQLQQAFAQFHAVNQQLTAQLAAIGNSPMVQGVPPNQPPAQTYQPQAFPQPAFQHAMAQQQQARAAGGQHPIHNSPMQNVQVNPATTFPQAGLSSPQSNSPGAISAPPTTPGNSSTVVRENHGPNGERWQMVIQSGPVNMHTQHGIQNHAPSPNAFHAGPNTPRRPSPALQSTHSPQTTGFAAREGSLPPPAGIGRTPSPNIALMHFQSNLSAMDAAMAGGNPLAESVFENAQETLGGIQDLPEDVASALRTRLADLSHHSSQLRENLHSHLIRAAHERVASQRAPQGTESSAVYILSSPSGPHALLVSPSGMYTTPWQYPSLGAITPHSMTNPTTAAPAQNQPNNNDPFDGQQLPADEAQLTRGPQQAPQPADAAQVAQVQQQQEVNQARDLARVLIPLGGHLWLLIRLFGFVYFFTAGAGWRRTMLLGLIAGLVFIAQTGIFRPVIQGIWDPIRRHAEGLVPLAANERPLAGADGDNANRRGTQPANREPTPQEAAERLLQERDGQDVSYVRQSFRRIERAVALFVASLVPGVGERHIAAREAAEAARQVEAREREERAKREEEEREQQERIVADRAGERGGSSGTPEQQQATQPPLVEV